MNTQIAIFANQSDEVTMSSLEIAQLTGKDHKHVLRDIRKMLDELEIDAAQFWATQKIWQQ